MNTEDGPMRAWIAHATVVTFVVTLVCLFVAAAVLGAEWNHTPSIPTGLYVEDAQGMIASFCPSGPWAELSVEREYRTRSHFTRCTDGGEPLHKRIVAESGDTVDFSATGVEINGIPLANSVPLLKDSKGRPLKPYPYGRYELRGAMVWVAGDDPRSFDSRYLGPVPEWRITRMRKF